MTPMTYNDDTAVTISSPFIDFFDMLLLLSLQENVLSTSADEVSFIASSDPAERAAATFQTKHSAAWSDLSMTLRHTDLSFSFTLTQQRS